MAQPEDTELRDLVIQSLEKNGSLAKIRALLRVNVLKAFEEECENPKQNESLDKILKIPEGKMSLCIIHEFLEFCNLKNTLFVYTAETRQGKDYNFENITAQKLNVPKLSNDKEPVLITILKECMRRSHNKLSKRKEDQNCTYIVNEDTSTTSSQSQSDSSSDEKNKLDLRLTLNNSDTDTSSECAKDQSRSEYAPNQQYYNTEHNKIEDKNILQQVSLNVKAHVQPNYNIHFKNEKNVLHDPKMFNNSSTDSTSYMELKPLNALDEVLHNTSGLPVMENDYLAKNFLQSLSSGSQNDSISSMKGLSSNTEELSNKDNVLYQAHNKLFKSIPEEKGKNDTDTMEIEYSYDFSPPISELKLSPDNKTDNSESLQNKLEKKADLPPSPSSRSSISISDVADLISEKNSPSFMKDKRDVSNRSKDSSKSNIQLDKEHVKAISDDSGDFSESSVPSLSNLSLDIHSD